MILTLSTWKRYWRSMKSTPAKGGRKPYHHGHLRVTLVEEAARLAAARGLDAVTLRAVARQAGVSHAAPYHHFADKAAMMEAVAEEGFRRLDRRMADSLRGAPADPYERLRRMGMAYIRFAVANPHFYGVMFKPGRHRAGAEATPDAPSTRAFQRLLDAVAACRASAGDPDADPTLWALVAWTVTHGLSSLWLEGALAKGPLGKRGIARLAEHVTRAMAPTFQLPPAATPPHRRRR
jgi:AcrR family transcriptional regulator